MAYATGAHNPAVTKLYLDARRKMALRTQVDLDGAKTVFTNALAIDPTYAPAHAGLADVYVLMGVYGFMPRDAAYAAANSEAATAIGLQKDLAQAHASMGVIQQALWKRVDAEASFQEAIRLNPDSAQTHHWYSIFLTQQGNFSAALEEIDASLCINPDSTAAKAQRASVHAMTGTPAALARAETEFRALQPAYPQFAHRALVQVCMHIGDLKAADAALTDAWRYAPPYDRDLKEDEACLRVKQGDTPKATAILQALETMWTNGDKSVANNIAAIYAVWGNVSQALLWLGKADAENDPDLAYLKVDPKWVPLHNAQGYKNIVLNRGL